MAKGEEEKRDEFFSIKDLFSAYPRGIVMVVDICQSAV